MKDNSGPAFPAVAYGIQGDSYLQEGMTLRQYYAGQAMMGLCASIKYRPTSEPQEIVASACKLADALLAELSKSNGSQKE